MKRVLLLGLALAATTARAFDPFGGTSWYLDIENDVPFHTDRWYTSGVRLYRSAPLAEGGQRLDVGLVQEIYTNDANCKDCPYQERPNAARLLLSIARQDVRPSGLTTLGIDAGVTGPSALGRQSQDFIHRFISANKSDWSQQVHNQFDGSLVAAHSQRLVGDDTTPWSVTGHIGAVAGTVISHAHVGGEVRFGRGPAANGYAPVLRYAATPVVPARVASSDFSVFLGASVRHVFRNRTLIRESGDFAPEATRKDQVSRIAAGTTFALPWFTVNFALVQESREFAQQAHPQRYGTLTLQYDFQ